MDERKNYRAYICCGPNCSLKHSSRLVDALQREVDAAGLGGDVEVMPGGCQSHCERGVSMVVWPGPVHYELVDEKKLRRIVREHLALGRQVREFFYTEPDAATRERQAARRAEALRVVEERIAQRRTDRTVTPPPAPAPPTSPNKRQSQRPSWRTSDGDVDDFKW